MHRDQIRLFPGDVESQVRRLEKFRAPPVPVLVDEATADGGECRYDLDYYPRVEPRALRDWLLETFYNPGLLLVVGMLALMSGGKPRFISIIAVSILTGPAIWLAFRAIGPLSAMMTEALRPRRRHFILC